MEQGYLLSGRYQLIEEIGAGGMAKVYRGYERALDRDIAVKVITANVNAVADYEERFNREARIVAKLQHPAIIQIHYYGIDTIGSYVVMPLLNGGTLAERMQQATKLISVRELGELALKVGGALHHAHQNNIIHRDIKFSNIMFDEGGNPYVMDFGIARLMSQTGLTMTGTYVGTPQFMAPEQWRGEITASVDQYALAVVLYELLSGNPPFEASTAHEYMFKHMQVEPKPVKFYREDVPEGISAALARAMSKDPDERFPTIQKFVESLNEVALSTPNESTGFFTYPLAPKQPVPLKPQEASQVANSLQPPITPQPPPLPTQTDSQARKQNLMNLLVPVIVVVISIGFVLLYFFSQQATLNANATLAVEQTTIAQVLMQGATGTQSFKNTVEALIMQETSVAETVTATALVASETEQAVVEIVPQVPDESTATLTVTSPATATNTLPPTATNTLTSTATNTLTSTATNTLTPTAINTPTWTPTLTVTPTTTNIPTEIPLPTNTPYSVVDFYREDFDDEAGISNWLFDHDQWFVTSFEGRSVFESSAGINYPVTIQSPQGISGWTQSNPQDLYMSMRFYLDRESVGLRIVFDYSQRGYHVVEIAPGAITVKRNNDSVNITDRNSERVIGTRQGIDLPINTWHEVKIWANSEMIYVYLNNELVMMETDRFIATSGSVVPGDIILQTISPPWSAYIDEFVIQRVDPLSTHFTDANNLPNGWLSDVHNYADIDDENGNYYMELRDAGKITTSVQAQSGIEFYCRLLNVEGGYQINFVGSDGSTLRLDFRFGTLDILLVNPDGTENNLRNIPNFYGYNSWNVVFLQILGNEIYIARDGNARQNNAILPIPLQIDTLQFATFENDVLYVDDCMVREIPQ